MSTIQELDKRLEKSADDFAAAMREHIQASSCDGATREALDEIARQTFYALRETQKEIVRYLESK